LIPDFEIKFLLDSAEVLNHNEDNEDIEFKNELRSVFKSPPTATKINVMFMDTDNKALYQAGWSARIRKKEGNPDFELTYKKRYPIEGEDIDAALRDAKRDGFDASRDDKYEAQVEWGYNKRTLSISHEKKVPDSVGGGTSLPDGGTSLPDVDSARNMIACKAPDLLGKLGKDPLQEARVYGPILTTRLAGKWESNKLTVEVWPIMIAAERRLEYIVEASVKVDTQDESGDVHRSLKDMLSGRGWLCPRDALKTQLIMDNY
jgi:hypothetical protein